MHRHQRSGNHHKRVVPAEAVENVAVSEPDRRAEHQISANSDRQIKNRREGAGDPDGLHHARFGALMQLAVVEGDVVVAAERHGHDGERDEEILESEIEELDRGMNETVVDVPI